ncbi:MAG: extracellular solute-binding protein, partial [Clostridia bacterium]|nr:extracellular solute-binding protein [Clostridia bacterium]
VKVEGAKDDEPKELKWSECAACYMWGTTGIVYNEDAINEIGSLDDVSSWKILTNENYKRRVTIKDNVRDSYFTALGIANLSDLSEEELAQIDRDTVLNAKDEESVAKAEDVLKKIKDNVYSFETDSGKADMITGKVAANLQWSGDAVYIMDQAESDKANPTELWFSVPEECTNLWFDGWVMLKDGIGDDEKKQEAAEAFVNFLSRPDNAIRNMYYIGYTSAIAGQTVLDYLNNNYEPEEGAEIYDYDLSYFFGSDLDAVIVADASTFDAFDENGNPNRGRQLFAQYPPLNVIERSVVMRDFEDALPAINQMWINVRCLDVKDFDPAVVWTVLGIAIAGGAAITLYKLRYKIFIRLEKTA